MANLTSLSSIWSINGNEVISIEGNERLRVIDLSSLTADGLGSAEYMIFNKTLQYLIKFDEIALY